jgi:multidrug transporter EmrE-like cation transporter
MRSLSTLPLSIAYPILVGTTVLGTAGVSAILLKEQLTPGVIVGIGAIAFGLLTIASTQFLHS